MPVRHVLLNALFLAPGHSGGPETYMRELGEALFKAYPDVRFTVVTTRSGATALRAAGWGDAGVDVRSLPCEDGQRGRRTLAEQVLLPALARRLRPDIVHSLASVAPIRIGRPAVITVHDVIFMVHRTFGAVTTWGMTAVVSRAARHADGLIAISAAARDEICRVLSIDPDRFSVVHHGYGRPVARALAPAEQVRAHYGLEGRRVVVCVAAKRPHKNQAVLIRAVERLDADVVILLAGVPEPYDAELRALAGRLGVADRVRFADYVPDPELETLWSLAAAAALPTLAEGFGLPLLEALARGVPVACSDIAVLRELGGGLPRYFDPIDPADAARAIAEAMRADADIRAAGRALAETFTWEAAAHGTFAAYERTLRRCTSG